MLFVLTLLFYICMNEIVLYFFTCELMDWIVKPASYALIHLLVSVGAGTCSFSVVACFCRDYMCVVFER